MKLPFFLESQYTTQLTRTQIGEELSTLPPEKEFGGLRKDVFRSELSDNGFVILRNTYGVDGFTLEQYPSIRGVYVSESPVVMDILIRPDYFSVIFFSIFVFTFIPAGVFIDKMTINGVYRVPSFLERLMFASLGGGIPGLWCYFGYIRPIKKAERWIMEKLGLTKVDPPVI